MLICTIFFTAGCAPEQSVDAENIVTIRIANDPDNLNPMRSRSSYATQIENLILVTLAEFDPVTLELSPLLVKSLARKEPLPEGGTRFHYEIRPEATWEDGIPITGADVLFTLKTVFNPKVTTSWKGLLSFIKKVEVDAADPRKFSIDIPENYMLAEVISCNFNVFPKHVYDPEGIMDSFAFEDLINTEKVTQLDEAALQTFAENFMSEKYNRDVVSGAGAYRLEHWATGEYIRLIRKKDWWGDKVVDPPNLLKAHPSEIIYKVIPDENTAITALKDGSIDLLSEVTPANFIGMRDDPQYADKFAFLSPQLMQYNYLLLNNRDPRLADKRVRQALAHVVDYKSIMEDVMLGLADRTIGPFSPRAGYYNGDLTPLEQDIDLAKTLLSEAGWEDTNADGIVDKVLDGQRQELNLDVIVTQREVGQKIALLLKDNGRKAGIDIDIVTKEGRMLSQDIRKRDFEILPLRTRLYPGAVDPHQNWHSDSDRPGGNNRSGFSTERSDELIEQIRLARSADQRQQLYLELQELIYEEQPVVFLYVPFERIIVSKQFQVEPSSRRPGYCENLFRLN